MTTSVIVLTGASSQIGYFLIPQLIASGHRIVAVSRKPLPNYWHCYKNQTELQWLSSNQLDEVLKSVDFTLVSAGPLALAEKLLNSCKPRQILAISTASVYFKYDSADPEEKKLITEIQESEKRISLWGREQLSAVTILRPTLVYGCGLDQNLTRVANLINRWGFLPIAKGAKGLRQPVHAQDIASLISNLLSSDSLPIGIWPLTGASHLSYKQMMIAVFKALDKKPRLIPLPQWLLALISRVLLSVNPAMIARQNQDLTLEDQSAQEQLGWSPRSFRLKLSDLQPPTT